ncbi:MAG: chemotaxis protein CheW [Hydrogenophaga sp.]|nr:chemotaxis protein CheW [Hydrogenophaga sp.]
MANRQSLKDLQVRLAERLTAARTEAASASWLAVEAGGQHFLIPLVQSGEIFSWTNLQTVPYTKNWYVGVSSLRGGLHGVVDLGALAGRDTSTSGRIMDRVNSESRLVSLHPALGVNAVLWIDRLLGLRNPSMFDAIDESESHPHAWFARRLTDPQGRVWQELNLQALAADTEFLAIAI